MPTDVKEIVTEARRRQIIEAAAGLFAEKGFYRATTKEIADAAGVSEGTIYNYFKNKEDLLFSMMQTLIMESVRETLEGPPPEDPRDMLYSLYLDRVNLLRRKGDLILSLFPQVFTNEELRSHFFGDVILPLARRIEEQISTQIERGVFRQVNTTVATRAMMGFIIVYAVFGMSGQDQVLANTPPEELAEEVTSLFLDGLRARPGEGEQKGADVQ